MIARGAGDFFQPKRDIGLRPEIEFHVGMDREGVEALLADAPPISVRPHKPFIDGEVRLFADGTADCVEPSFHFLLRKSHHIEIHCRLCATRVESITGGEMESQPHHRANQNT